MVRLPVSERVSELTWSSSASKHLPEALFRSEVWHGLSARAPTTIERESGQRIVNVRAELAATARSSQNVVADLNETVFPRFRSSFPARGLLVGEQRDQAESG